MNVSNCCNEPMPNYPESDLCPRCHEHCMPDDASNEPSSLDLYLEYRKFVRESQEGWLHSRGMNWKALDELESEAIAEMIALGGSGIQVGNYFATLESKPVKIAKDAGLVIDTKHSISLHSKRS